MWNTSNVQRKNGKNKQGKERNELNALWNKESYLREQRMNEKREWTEKTKQLNKDLMWQWKEITG